MQEVHGGSEVASEGEGVLDGAFGALGEIGCDANVVNRDGCDGLSRHLPPLSVEVHPSAEWTPWNWPEQKRNSSIRAALFSAGWGGSSRQEARQPCWDARACGARRLWRFPGR